MVHSHLSRGFSNHWRPPENHRFHWPMGGCAYIAPPPEYASVRSIRSWTYSITLPSWVSLILNAWSQYPMLALLSVRINAWSLHFSYPCRVWPPLDTREKLSLSVGLHGMEINAWSRDLQHKSSDFSAV